MKATNRLKKIDVNQQASIRSELNVRPLILILVMRCFKLQKSIGSFSLDDFFSNSPSKLKTILRDTSNTNRYL